MDISHACNRLVRCIPRAVPGCGWLCAGEVEAACVDNSDIGDALTMGTGRVGARTYFYRIPMVDVWLFASCGQPIGWFCAVAWRVRCIADSGGECRIIFIAVAGALGQAGQDCMRVGRHAVDSGRGTA